MGLAGSTGDRDAHHRAQHGRNRAAAAASAAHGKGRRIGRHRQRRTVPARRRLGRPAVGIPGLQPLARGARRGLPGIHRRDPAQHGGRLPALSGTFGTLRDLDLLPKPTGRHLPILAIGSAQQSLQWIARNLDGWVTYFRPVETQRPRLDLWRSVVETQAGGAFLPFAQSMFIDLADDPDTAPSPIFLGYRLGRNRLIEELQALARLGANHVGFNLRHSVRPARDVLQELAECVLPLFPSA